MNLLDLEKGIIVQQVNAQGVMGAGIAKQIRNRYPIVWDEYANLIASFRIKQPLDIERSELLIGKVLLVQVKPELFVANLFGQQFYRGLGQPEFDRYTSYDALDSAFKKLADLTADMNLTLNYPLIGCDLGGGHWPIVKAIINHRLRNHSHKLWLLPGVAEPQ